MAGRIYFNGTAYPSRTGADKFGTFYYIVAPPEPSGTLVGAMEITWGSRLAEMTGRVRGLSGFGTVPHLGTLNILFPEMAGTIAGGTLPLGYFTHSPLVKAYMLVKTKVKYSDFADLKDESYLIPLQNTNWKYSVGSDGKEYGQQDLNVNYGIQVRLSSIYGLTFCDTTPTYWRSFGNMTDDTVIYWHAFGI